jgi:short-subunit dehydrogenase involved in D-alanine esterification of teichoic acids
MTLSDRSVLVTGATSGVGRALAYAFAEHGAHVLVHGRDARRLTEVSAAVSVLVNNAAIQMNYLLTEQSPSQTAGAIAQELSVDLVALLQTTALMLPVLRSAAEHSGKPSVVVNVTSGLALAPKKTAAVYCAAKAGLRTFSKALRYQAQDATEAGAHAIRIVEAMLPLVDTPMTDERESRVGKMDPEAVAEEILSGMRSGCPEIYVGKARTLRLLHRWMPQWADRLLRDG